MSYRLAPCVVLLGALVGAGGSMAAKRKVAALMPAALAADKLDVRRAVEPPRPAPDYRSIAAEWLAEKKEAESEPVTSDQLLAWAKRKAAQGGHRGVSAAPPEELAARAGRCKLRPGRAIKKEEQCRRVLEALKVGPMTVAELAWETRVGWRTVSRRLQELRAAGGVVEASQRYGAAAGAAPVLWARRAA
jgi:DNA-binding transcriptional ArsR family regulator